MVIAAAFIYCLTKPLYLNAWYPLLDSFLLPQERALFFGRMRFLYQLLSSVLFLLFGALMGKNPPLIFFQVIIALSALSILGRSYYVERLPIVCEKRSVRGYDFAAAFRIAVRNSPLTGFSVYVCFVTLGYTSIVPLVYIYMKSHLQLPPNSVVSISGLAMSGVIVGYLCAGRLQGLLGTKWLQVLLSFKLAAICLVVFPAARRTPTHIFG